MAAKSAETRLCRYPCVKHQHRVGCFISPTDFKLLTRMYYNLSYPPAELMEGQAPPGIIIIHYYFIKPAGVILTAAHLKEYIKDRPHL